MKKTSRFSGKAFVRNATLLDLNSAIEWFLRSGIQSIDGGLFAWYDIERERYSFLYPEITGYTIRLLLQLYRETGLEKILRNAILAGGWLLKIQRPTGSFYCKYFEWNPVAAKGSLNCDRSQYTFDAGICLSAFIDLFEATSCTEYLDASRKTADWLISFQNHDGSITAGYRPGCGMIDDCRWSMTRSCHNIKQVIPLLKLYKLLGDEKYIIATERLLKWGEKLQSKDGRFLVSPENEETYVHAHCYAVEGLLYAANFLEDRALLKRAVSGSTWLSRIQNDDGSIWNWYNSNKQKIKVSDATSQALRLWLILEREGIMNFSTNIEKGFSFVSRMQCLTGDKRSFGGIYYGDLGKKKIKHVNSCVTMFAIQASLFRSEKGNPSLIDMLL